MRTVKSCFIGIFCLLFVTGMAATSPQDSPEVKKRVEPWYPELLKLAGIEGKVFLKVVIDQSGKVESAEVLKTTDERFNQAAIEAMKKWEFSPAMKDGKPIKSEVTVPFRFVLAEKSDKSQDDELYKLRDEVLNLLRGSVPGDLKLKISAEAYAVIGNKYEHLLSVFTEKAKSHLLVEGPETQFEMSQMTMGDARDMAVLVLKTRSGGKAERFHTVVFVKPADGQWKIRAWQAGA